MVHSFLNNVIFSYYTLLGFCCGITATVWHILIIHQNEIKHVFHVNLLLEALICRLIIDKEFE